MTANVCTNTLMYKIAFNYKNETYLISTGYIIDYNHKIINELNKLGISIINNYRECNWYLIKKVWNTGVNTGNIYIQGPNYDIQNTNIQNIIDFLEKNYPITETLVGICLGLILPLIFIFVLYIIMKKKKRYITKNTIHDPHQHDPHYIIKREIDDKIKNHIFSLPSYESVYNIKIYKQFFYYEYSTNFHKYIDEKIEEYIELLKNNNYDTCIKCKTEKVKLYQNKYNLYECEKCKL